MSNLKIENNQPTDESDSITEPVSKKKSIAVIQLSRFGDLIQTAQASIGLKSLEDDKRPYLILIARKQFARPLKFLLENVFDEIHYLDFEHIFSESDKGLANAQEKLREFTGPLNEKRIDVLINLTFSKSSAYLNTIINSTFKLGPSFSYGNQMVIPDTWSKYIFSNVMGGPFNPFNLIDVFSSIIGSTKDGLNPSLIKRNSNKIVIHPFASHEKKRWKANKWVEIIFKTLKENPDAEIQIVGSKKEREQAELILNNPTLKHFANRMLNYTGLTDLEQLYVLLTRAKIFIGHDSMVSHLASVAQTQSLVIAIGTVRPHETLAYLDGNYAIAPKTGCFPCFPDDKCEQFKCHTDIPYQVVTNAITQLYKNHEISVEELEENTSAFHLNNVKVYKNQFNKSSSFIQAKDVSKNSLPIDDVFRTLYRIMWMYNFTEKEETVDFPSLTAQTVDELKKIQEGIKNLFELTEFGKKYSKYILEEISSKTPNVVSIKKFSNNIDEIARLQEIIKQNFKYLSPLVDYGTTSKSNLKGNNLVELTESSYLSFEELGGCTSVLYELVEKSIAQYNKQKNARIIRP